MDLVIRDRIGDLLADGFDIAVRFGQLEDRRVERRLLFESRVVTCASPAFVARAGLPTRPDDLLDARFRTIRLLDDVTAKPHPWQMRNGHAVRLIDPGGRLVLNDAGSILAATLAGAGISRLLDFIVADLIRREELVEILPDWNRTFWPAYVYYNADAHQTPALRAFVDFVSDVVCLDRQPLIMWLSSQR